MTALSRRGVPSPCSRFPRAIRGNLRTEVQEAHPEKFAPTSAERIAQNDAIFREANEDIAEAASRNSYGGAVPFICDCAEPTCRELVRLSLDEYQAIRNDPRAFVNAKGHQVAARGWAEVIAETDGHVVVRKIGEAGEIAEDLAGDDDQR